MSMDEQGTDIPYLNPDAPWAKELAKNAKALYSKEKPLIDAGKPNLSIMVKDFYKYIGARSINNAQRA